MSNKNIDTINTSDKDEGQQFHAKQDYETEMIGSTLSHSLKNSTPYGSCLSDEEIAGLVDGAIKNEDEDRMMKHLASCTSCYEIYRTTWELFSAEANTGTNTSKPCSSESMEKQKFMIRIEEESAEELTKEKRRPLWRSRGWAIAASLFIAVASLVIFFQFSEIPKSSRELMSMKEPTAEQEKTRAGESSSPVKDEEQNTSGKQFERENTVKESRDEKEKKEIAPPKEAPFTAAPEQKKTGTTQVDSSDSDGSRNMNGSYADQTSDSRVKEGELNSQLKEKTAVIPAAPTVIKSMPNNVTNQASGSVQQQKKGIAQVQSETLEAQFKQVYEGSGTMQFAAKVSEETSISKKGNNQNIGQNDKDLNTYSGNAMEMQGLESNTNEMTTIDNNGTKVPNMAYFLSRSTPGSVEYRFFSLTQYGWCDKNKYFHKGEYITQARNLRRENTDDNRSMKQFILKEWEALLPELKGIYLEIAKSTIAYLKNSIK